MTLLRPRPCCWGQCCPSVPTTAHSGLWALHLWEGQGERGQEGPRLPAPTWGRMASWVSPQADPRPLLTAGTLVKAVPGGVG